MNEIMTNFIDDSIINVDFSKMNTSEFKLLQEKIQHENIKRMESTVNNLVNKTKKQDEKIYEHDLEIEQQNERITKQEKLTNVIGFGIHSKKFKMFKKVCASRVYSLLDGSTSVNFILWQSYFFKKIYADIANHFDVDTCKNINIENYQEAKDMGTWWTPDKWYIKEKLDEMKSKRDMGMLKPERCMALTVYLQNTNDGEINPF